MYTILNFRLQNQQNQVQDILSRFVHQNHYDVLNLKSNCTEKDIRNSFVKLSKECHPDLCKINSKQNIVQFTKIMDAYKVLSKPESRAAYDYKLKNPETYYHRTNSGYDFTQYSRTTEWNHVKPDEYYGIKGMKKVSNWKIVGALALLASIGVSIQIYAIRNSITMKRTELDDRSINAGVTLSSVRAEAEKYGNKEQLQRLIERISRRSSSN